MAPVKVHRFPLHIVIDRCREIPGRWNAHCLELDVMSWHDTVQGAFDMIREAVQVTLVHEVSQGRDPSWRSAPQEDWDAMWARMRSARMNPAPLAAGVEPEFVIIETMLQLAHVVGDAPAQVPEFTPEVTFLPALALSA